MLIRARLALWYGTLCGTMLMWLSLLVYAVFAQSQYLDLDRQLLLVGSHVEASWKSNPLPSWPTEGRSPVAVRLYHPDGKPSQGSASALNLPYTDPAGALQQGTRPVLPWWVQWVPALGRPVELPGHAVLDTLQMDQQRWRRYVARIMQGNRVLGYVETLIPLEDPDKATSELLRILLALTLGFAALATLLAWSLARTALQPVQALTRTAARIRLSGDLQQRVRAGPRQDELGELAFTFNSMLDSLEQAVGTQRRFLADASHELRTPLAVLRSNLEMLGRYPHMTAEERAEIVQDAEQETLRLIRLVEDLLALAKWDAGVPLVQEPVELHGVITQVFQDARTLSKGHHLHLQSTEGIWVMGDPDRLKQVFLILLDNALCYTPSGGSVKMSLAASEDQVTVQVQDSGMGMTEKEQEQVFERFFRTDGARRLNPSGSGLGLPIARWVVENHGGSLKLQSQPGKGTTVTVVLPLSSGKTP